MDGETIMLGPTSISSWDTQRTSGNVMRNAPELAYDRPFQKYLMPGEALLWVGRPPQGILLRRSDWASIPFSIAFCGLALMWEATALGLWRMRYNACPSAVGLPFVAVGLYVMVGRFFLDAYQRRRTWYGLTDRRALILYIGQSVCLNGVMLSESPGVQLEMHSKGVGTITFKPRKIDPYWENRAGRGGFLDFGRPSLPTFEQIADAKEVRNLIHPESTQSAEQALRRLHETKD